MCSIWGSAEGRHSTLLRGYTVELAQHSDHSSPLAEPGQALVVRCGSTAIGRPSARSIAWAGWPAAVSSAARFTLV
ncbi:hypothetical protein PhaeoP88_04077 (plasmid) [Phaeobacter inhibens]|uniref:Uncharacterized protein n=1 Tax=Phaeobacter inhibens TaxID=221822 RepID=A0A2I7KFL7_9RHOB|nr:hypothetical protein PhaeoP88_04077 [Phaeobacter inhibens]